MNEQDPPERTHKWFQVISVFICCILVAGNGTTFCWPSPAIPKLLAGEYFFNVTLDEVSYIVMLSPLSYTVGAPLTSILIDRIGRKSTMIFLALPLVISWSLIAKAKNIYMLYISRVISGISEAGTFIAVPIYIGEISEPQIRGALAVYFTVSISFGFLLINLYGSCLPLTHSAYISISLPLLFLVLSILIPESPYFLLMKNHSEKARKSLKKLRRCTEVEDELNKLTVDVGRQLAESGDLKDIFLVQANRKSFCIIITLRTIQQLNGGATIVFYNQLIFLEANGVFSHTLSSLMYYSITFLMSFISTFFIDRFGRKPLLLISIFGTTICLFIEGVYFYLKEFDYDITAFRWIPVTAIVTYVIFRSIGIQGIPTVLSGEIHSTSIKAKACGIGTIYFGLIISICSKVFQSLMKNVGMYLPFFLFTFFSVLGIVYIWFCVPETKGISLQEIQNRLSISR